MKSFVNFTKSMDDYSSREFSSDEMCNLGSFFSTDYYLYGYQFLMKWIQDPEQHCTNANLTNLGKENRCISIGYLFRKEQEQTMTFDLPVEKFIKLLNDWERVTKEEPQNITITKNGNTVIVKGSN